MMWCLLGHMRVKFSHEKNAGLGLNYSIPAMIERLVYLHCLVGYSGTVMGELGSRSLSLCNGYLTYFCLVCSNST